MADPILWTKFKKFLDFDGTRFSGIFEVADSESELKIQKFKIVDWT